MSKSILSAILIGLGCAIAAIMLNRVELIKTWELKTYDWRMKVLPATTQDDVAILYVDEPSLRHMESMGVGWPWPRELYSLALNFLKRGKAKAVFFDIIFSEDSVYGVADDEKFGEGIAKGPPAYFALFASKDEGPGDLRLETILEKSRTKLEGPLPDFLPQIHSFKSLPIPTIVENAHAFGNVQVRPDIDGVYRQIPLALSYGKQTIPSMAMKIASDIEGMRMNESGRLLLRYPKGLDSVPTYSLAEVLVSEQQLIDGQTPQINPSVFRNKVVIVGLSAPGLLDLKSSPIASITPGPFIHAVAISNLINHDAMTPAASWVTNAVIVITALVAAVGLILISTWWGIALFIVILFGAIIGASFGLFKGGYWLPLIPPLMAGILSSTGTLARNYLTEGRSKKAIKKAFGQYIAPEVVSEIAKDPENVKLGGKRTQLTVLFSDIANFTTTSEKMAPEELVKELNKYLTAVTKVILESKGTVDKYIGDAVMAFWGAPLEIPDHQRRATLAALAVQEELKGFPKFMTRIGIHTGDVVVGNIGSDLRFNYTAIGDTVNLASRLEGLNKHIGTRVLISETTLMGLDGDVFCRKAGRVRVKGRHEPIDIFEPLGPKDSIKKSTFDACALFESGLGFLTDGNFEEAQTLFRRTLEAFDDPVAKYYLNLCDRLLENKPLGRFDGILDFDTK
jgi:adenylate cyclase